MDITALSLALRTADLGSFSAVARELDIAPSSVSRAVAAVEDRLGLRLFQRTSRTLSLTDEGEAYLRRVAPLIDQFEAARHEARAERARPTGRLRMTASVAYGTRRLIPMLEHLREAAPDLEVEMILSDGNLDMVAERIDLAVRLAAAPEGDLISARLHDTRYRVVVSPGWLEAQGNVDKPTDLASLGRVDKTSGPEADASDVDEAEEARGCLVVAGRDAAAVLELSEAALDQVA